MVFLFVGAAEPGLGPPAQEVCCCSSKYGVRERKNHALVRQPYFEIETIEDFMGEIVIRVVSVGLSSDRCGGELTHCCVFSNVAMPRLFDVLVCQTELQHTQHTGSVVNPLRNVSNIRVGRGDSDPNSRF